MLHLDQKHNSSLSSPHSKPSTLILSNPARTDQQPLLSWSAPNRDERPFFQEQQDHPVAEQAPVTPLKPDVPPVSTETPTEQAASTGSQPPGNAEDSKLSDQSPSSPPDATSPALESTSSLTPPPSATSPAFSSVDLPDAEATDQQRGEGAEEEDKVKGDASGDAGDKPSQASTPLSELSSAPEGDEPQGGEKKADSADDKPKTESGENASVADLAKDAKGSSESTSNGEETAKALSFDANGTNDSSAIDYRGASGSRATSIASKRLA